jgi:DNA-binding IscR family transcriptional regulator
MKRNGQLSGVLHVLLHMAEFEGPVTSETLARAMDTNPVVVRRVMAGLRERGFVRSEKGHGGGWTLNRALDDITLRDVYEALGAPALLALGSRNETPSCLVEQAVNQTLGRAFADAETLLLQHFASVTLATLHADFHARRQRRGRPCIQEHSHDES